MASNIKTPNAKTHEAADPSELANPDLRIFYNRNRTAESDRRLTILNETILGYQEEHSFVIGATAFGSTIHGGAHAESDIDAFVFVDPDSLPEEFSSKDDDGRKVLTSRDASEMGRAIQVDLMQGLGETVTRNGKHEKNDIWVFAVNGRYTYFDRRLRFFRV